ncbi:TetR/AcrR family transcriptional regulator [Sciscionella sediminilitoris]|uniref:TetR/AcrR family transcriptional regulator n=1 Tax=Sciscionella sediminilitoris TaxID=1445613 RepID=UPI000689D5F0|nr:TetR/AcrR family transcriptional regulator [Sciscionella sp. SE31]
MAGEGRLTQAQRRAATSARLVEGTISALSEVGYARTTVREICARAGVSHGALFGRFPALIDLVLATAREVAQRQVDSFERKLAQLADRDDLSAVLGLLQASARAPINAVWVELNAAARTDADLRARLQPVADEYAQSILAASREVSLLRRLPERIRPVMIAHIIFSFDGEALARISPDSEFDRRHIGLIVDMLRAYEETFTDSTQVDDKT